ncbi:MAG TPA: universal stress protein [Terracidiphilus sp.]|nr:universal stress protein [Terracidiphilus sp.]
MGLITNILFPVDFSPSCIGMAAYVKRAAVLFGARVSLIHIFDPASYSGLELYVRNPTEIADEHLAIARDRLDSFLRAEFPASENPRILGEGEPATEIAKAARHGFDLIMMPTHAGRFRRMLIGSTTAKVLDSADCPVATSMHAETIAPRPLEHREWLCALSLREDSERVLRYAYRATAEAGVHLRIIHAISAADPALPVRLDLEEQIQCEQRRDALKRIDELQGRIGSNAAVRIEIGPVKEALLEAARQSDADALIIGRSAWPGSHGRLLDLAYAMIRDSPFPVVSV